ncbi:unnamed protein product [Blepharisma stoltei]|uniref:Succinate dehydrogenase subunit 4 n=1 Tax=Blepharisma stoltei TaxID=1481888 RepID=A0AAU9JLP9_9CILI|nr:unnamed protein product [Blepharisma stoltei]
MMSIRSLRRVFSSNPIPESSTEQQNGLDYYQTLEFFKPIISLTKTPTYFKNISLVSLFPLLGGGISVIACPYLGLMPTLLPEIAKYTCVYAALHSTFLSGIHIGLGSVFYDPNLMNEDGQYIKKQLAFPLIVPVVNWALCCFMWAVPCSEIKFLSYLAAIGSVYVGTLALDTMYVVQRKTVPLWYRNWKVWMTIGSVSGLGLLIAGLYMHPELIIKIKYYDVKGLNEILEEQ